MADPMTPEELAFYQKLGKDLNAKTRNPVVTPEEVPRAEGVTPPATTSYESANISYSNTSTEAGGGTISFAVASATTKLSEAVSKTFSTLGESLPFDKLAANLPSIGSLTAAAVKAGSTLFGGTGQLVNNQISGILGSATSKVSASQAKAAVGQINLSGEHLVSLTEKNMYGDLIVEFDVMPEIVEARTVQYEAVAPSQFLGAFQKYKGTDSVQWTMNVTLISRNTDEATINLSRINTLRGWTMPFFGYNTNESFPGNLGAPPPVLTLKGLRKYILGPTPVVITSLNWNWPKDVDWLPTVFKGDDGNAVPFPSVMNVAIQLVESFSTTQFNQFSLNDYRNGDMDKSFNKPLPVPAVITQTVTGSSATTTTVTPTASVTESQPVPGRPRGGA